MDEIQAGAESDLCGPVGIKGGLMRLTTHRLLYPIVIIIAISKTIILRDFLC